MKTKTCPNSCKDHYGRLRVAAAVGVTTDVGERVQSLVDAGVDAIIVDTAHGHSKGVIDTVKKLKSEFKIDIIAGNIATEQAAIALADAGVDAVNIYIYMCVCVCVGQVLFVLQELLLVWFTTIVCHNKCV